MPNTESKDPGLAPFGNFINYYSFNSAEDRLHLLPDSQSQARSATITETATSIWSIAASKRSEFVVLDVGCNAGNFTQLLYDYLIKHTGKSVHILGIDLDNRLIERAQQHNIHPNKITYKCLDIMQSYAVEEIQSYLQSMGVERFDSVFCMSLTMWIHLNHGDDGLKAFLTCVSDLSRLLVLEPQPWKCYLTAVRRLKKDEQGFEHFAKLQWRQSIEDDIHEHLEQQCRRTRSFQSDPTKWKRKIAIYRT